MPLLRTFGRLALEGTELTRPQPLLLLAYLALEGPESREHVAQLFWPNLDRRRRNLSMALSRLREHLATGLRDDGEMLSADVPSDAGRFVEAIQEGNLQEAVRWYEGSFLPDAPGAAGGVELETWVLEQRDRFAHRACRAHLDLGGWALTDRDSASAAEHGELALRVLRRRGLVEPDLVADLHRLLRRCGSPDAAAAAGLLVELGIDVGDVADEEMESRPAPHVRLVGREADLDRVWSAVTAPDARLVTITGPAGVGKTSVALAVAQRAADAPVFSDGVRFVSLEASRTPAEVLGRLAGELGVADGSEALAAVLSALRGRDMLIVLDNFEHVLDAAADLGRILAAEPGATFLITSRTRLLLRDEREAPLSPLETRASGGSSEASASAELFVERVRTSDRSYRPGPAELAAIEEICRRLDGLPLAIELAAAHARAFELHDIRLMLDDRFELLRGGFRDAPERQRSLAAAVDWSYQLLDDDEKRFFRHLAVFRGSFDLDAAAHIVGGSRAHAAARLRTLVDQNLAKPTAGESEGSRFRLLETLRAYAERRLTQAAERTEAERANAERLATLVDRAARHLTGSERTDWTARLADEADNVRGALAWCAEAGASAFGLRIATGAWRYWVSRGELREARTWLETFVSAVPIVEAQGDGDPRREPSEEGTFAARQALATVLHELGAFTEARRHLETLLNNLDADDPKRAPIAVDLAWVLTHLGNLDVAEGIVRDARSAIDATVDPRLAALAENDLGWAAAYGGAWADAERWFRSSLELRRRAGDERGIAFAEVNVSWTAARGRGAFGSASDEAGAPGRLEPTDAELARCAAALARCEAAERVLLEMEDAQLAAWAGTVRAELLTACARPQEAADLAAAAVEAWRRVGNLDGLALAHEALAGALLAGNRAARAAEAARASLAIRDGTRNAWGMARVRIQLGLAALETGEPEVAAGRFREALDIATALENHGFMDLCRRGLGRSTA